MWYIRMRLSEVQREVLHETQPHLISVCRDPSTFVEKPTEVVLSARVVRRLGRDRSQTVR